MNERNDWHTVTQYLYHCWRICDEIYLNSEQGKVEFLRNYLFFPDDGLVFDGFFEDSVSAVILSRQKQLVRLLLGAVLNCLTSLVVETKRVTNTEHILSGTQIASL